MVDIQALEQCLSGFIRGFAISAPEDELLNQLRNPELAADAFEAQFRSLLVEGGIDTAELREHVRGQPYLHLRSIFSTDDLPDTPTVWAPVPTTTGLLATMLAVVLLNRLFGMETISYGSENNGVLFVNLVTLAGTGRVAEKSRASMKGHTDAASFPFRGTEDPDHPRIAPSPDVVFLAAFRNVEKVPTIVMPLQCALDQLNEAHKTVLKGPNLVISSQRSFQKGIEAILGEELLLDGTNVLFDSPEGTWVRYTHSGSVVANLDDSGAVEAKATFEAACAQCAQEIVLKSGDLLVVNNRKALHGRATVGDAIGGKTRWLVRSYGLDTTELADNRRHLEPRHKLYP